MQEICEIRIKKMEQLSSEAQKEVIKKVESKPDTFNFRGFVKVIYVETSPLKIDSVEPIEGTINDFFREITNRCGIS